MDLRTLFAAQTALLIATALMLWLARGADDRRNGLQAWTLAVTAQGAAYLLLSQAGRLPVLLTGPLGNLLGAFSVACFHVAILRFQAQPVRMKPLAAMVASVTVVAFAAGDAYGISTAFNGLAYGVIQLLNARALWRSDRPELRRVQRAVALAYLAMGVVLPLRALALAAQGLELDYLRQPLGWQEPLYVFGFLFLVVTNLGFVQMCKMRAESEVRQQAMTDDLTRLPNRRAFQAALQRAMAAGRRSARPFSIVLVDLDHFKSINDRLGHAGGDAALADFSQRLQAALRQQDECFRLGGEEFCVLLAGEPLPGAAAVTERLRRQVAQAATRDRPALTASFGVAQWTAEETADELLQRADRALYRAKAAGRDRVVADPAPAPCPA